MDEIVDVDDFSTEDSSDSYKDSETEDIEEELTDDEEDEEMPEAQFDASENDDSNDSIAVLEVCKKCEQEGELVPVNDELICTTCVVKLKEKKKSIDLKKFDIPLNRNDVHNYIASCQVEIKLDKVDIPKEMERIQKPKEIEHIQNETDDEVMIIDDDEGQNEVPKHSNSEVRKQ